MIETLAATLALSALAFFTGFCFASGVILALKVLSRITGPMLLIAGRPPR